jgi:RNA-directed DNA polymerase
MFDQAGKYRLCRVVRKEWGLFGAYDSETIEDFETDLKNNLYRIWNRMSSGSYFPPPVKAVAIPKKNGGERILGVPTVADRVAQMVVKMQLEPNLESITVHSFCPLCGDSICS